MEITIKTTVEEKVNIELPYYSKSNAHYFKVISEDLCLKLVDVTGNYFGIELSPYCVTSAFDLNNVQITEEEFNEAYFQIQSKLNQNL